MISTVKRFDEMTTLGKPLKYRLLRVSHGFIVREIVPLKMPTTASMLASTTSLLERLNGGHLLLSKLRATLGRGNWAVLTQRLR